VGTLYVVATPIGNLQDMTPRAIEVLRSVGVIAAEDTRHTGKLLKTFGIATPMLSYHHHNRAQRSGQLLHHLETGDVALVSDAGTPAIADPGHDLVVAAIEAGHTVVPIPGASSLVAAVSASGLVSGPLVFAGFLPRSGTERQAVLGRSVTTGWPLVLFESPLRVVDTLREVEAMAPGRDAVVARELTKLHEEFLRGKVAELAERLAVSPPRGEVVLVVGEAPPMPLAGEGHQERVARSILARGVKPSRAAREVAAILGIDSADAYDLVQRIQREG
jgi:16S rRNA (cytidine1402-2'-O)-methyltransferase